MVRLCLECMGEIETLSAGDESWDQCTSCRQIEGKTIEMTEEEYENFLDYDLDRGACANNKD